MNEEIRPNNYSNTNLVPESQILLGAYYIVASDTSL